MTQRNWPLIIQVIEKIQNDPDSWMQSWYVNECGTKFCVAGHAIVMSGHTFQADDDRYTIHVIVDDELRKLLQDDEVYTSHYSDTVDVADPDDAGRVLLGLTHHDAIGLFGGGNSLSDILRMVNRWAVQDRVTLPPEMFRSTAPASGGL